MLSGARASRSEVPAESKHPTPSRSARARAGVLPIQPVQCERHFRATRREVRGTLRSSFFLPEQGQKIAASINYAFDPDDLAHPAKHHHIPTHNRHPRALTTF